MYKKLILCYIPILCQINKYDNLLTAKCAYWPAFLSEPMYFLKFSSLPENIDRDFLTPHPSFNKYGWTWIGPEEDKDNKPKPWKENINTVTVMQWGEEVKINVA